MATVPERFGDRAQRLKRYRDPRWMERRVGNRPRRGLGPRETQIEPITERVGHSLHERRLVAPRSRSVRQGFGRRRGGGLALSVRQRGKDGVRPYTVGDRMMELEEERRSAVGKPVEEPRFPQRPRAIERRLIGWRDRAEELIEVARRRNRVLAQVVVDVERGIEGPVRQGEVEGRFHHVLAEPRHRGDGTLEGMAEPSRVGTAVQHEQHRHRGRLHWRVGPPEREILAREAKRRVGAHTRTGARSGHPSALVRRSASHEPRWTIEEMNAPTVRTTRPPPWARREHAACHERAEAVAVRRFG